MGLDKDTVRSSFSGNNVKEKGVESLVRRELIHCNEDDCKHRKPHVLDAFSANPVHGKHREKVSRQGDRDEDEIPNRYPLQVVNHLLQRIVKGARVKIQRIYG